MGTGIRCNSPMWLGGGGGGQHNMTAAHKTMFSSCMARRPTVLDKIDGKFVPLLPPPPPPPKQGWEIGAFWLLRCFILDLAGGGGVGGVGGLLFHFIPSKIAGAVSRGGRMVTVCSSCITYKGRQGHKM